MTPASRRSRCAALLTDKVFARAEFATALSVKQDQILDALAPEWQEQAWQPIETAPKDGDIVLGWPLGPKSEVGAIKWDCDPESEGGQCWRDIAVCDERCEPSKWQPLPAAPTGEDSSK